jgi:IclR family acetate operon transcriptional repressor
MIAVERSLDVLRLLSRHPDGASVKTLSDELGTPPSSTHRVLQVLVDERFAVQDPATRRYKLGPEVLQLNRAYLEKQVFATVARSHLLQLTAETGETSFATALVGTVPICVAMAECDRPLRLFIGIGQRMPYHAAASARAILAFMDPEVAEQLLRSEEPFEQFTERTPQSVPEVMAVLDIVRREGYALCEDEFDRHVAAVAAPVKEFHGGVSSSVTIVAMEERLRGRNRERVVRSVRETADRISQSMGHR